MVSEMAGMIYQGKALDVYMDGRPLNIYSTQLTAYLEGLPANSIERIEMITQPGAEFPATSGGAILISSLAEAPNLTFLQLMQAVIVSVIMNVLEVNSTIV